MEKKKYETVRKRLDIIAGLILLAGLLAAGGFLLRSYLRGETAYYTKPIFALTALEPVKQIRADRLIEMESVSGTNGSYSYRMLIIKDRYTLKNDSTQEQSVKLVYPLISETNPETDKPRFWLGGQEMDPVILSVLPGKAYADAAKEMSGDGYKEILQTYLKDLASEGLKDTQGYTSWINCYGITVAIPAGESTEIQIEISRTPEFKRNTALQSYSFMQNLNGHLNFSSVKAVLSGSENLELGKQNFGFDLKGGKKEVSLDPKKDRYYLLFKSIES